MKRISDEVFENTVYMLHAYEALMERLLVSKDNEVIGRILLEHASYLEQTKP